mmetsp:Transcript_138162/g.195570  ORF Transcript_138162/g.195570 Transcript_138162/m.195570 type:complete len:82 (+) Transcript_138162:69-314(+)
MSGITPEQQEMYLRQVRTQLASAALQEMLQKVGEKCFHKCVTRPGSSLSSSEQKCLAFCMDRYQDTQATVTQALINRENRQ